LLLIDLKLPLVSGIRVIRKAGSVSFASLGAWDEIMPIIATSLERPTSHRDLALTARCVAHMEKPYEPDQIGDVLDQFLPGTRASLISVLVH
jgi:CheY-like chemotaxis protein